MFLFRPSNNNQRYAFVPLLDQSDNDNDEFDDGDEDRGGKIFLNKKNQFTFVLHLEILKYISRKLILIPFKE
jgi:hypothetical protein